MSSKSKLLLAAAGGAGVGAIAASARSDQLSILRDSEASLDRQRAELATEVVDAITGIPDFMNGIAIEDTSSTVSEKIVELINVGSFGDSAFSYVVERNTLADSVMVDGTDSGGTVLLADAISITVDNDTGVDITTNMSGEGEAIVYGLYGRLAYIEGKIFPPGANPLLEPADLDGVASYEMIANASNVAVRSAAFQLGATDILDPANVSIGGVPIDKFSADFLNFSNAPKIDPDVPEQSLTLLLAYIGGLSDGATPDYVSMTFDTAAVDDFDYQTFSISGNPQLQSTPNGDQFSEIPSLDLKDAIRLNVTSVTYSVDPSSSDIADGAYIALEKDGAIIMRTGFQRVSEGRIVIPWSNIATFCAISDIDIDGTRIHFGIAQVISGEGLALSYNPNGVKVAVSWNTTSSIQLGVEYVNFDPGTHLDSISDPVGHLYRGGTLPVTKSFVGVVGGFVPFGEITESTAEDYIFKGETFYNGFSSFVGREYSIYDYANWAAFTPESLGNVIYATEASLSIDIDGDGEPEDLVNLPLVSDAYTSITRNGRSRVAMPVIRLADAIPLMRVPIPVYAFEDDFKEINVGDEVTMEEYRKLGFINRSGQLPKTDVYITGSESLCSFEITYDGPLLELVDDVYEVFRINPTDCIVVQTDVDKIVISTPLRLDSTGLAYNKVVPADPLMDALLGSDGIKNAVLLNQGEEVPDVSNINFVSVTSIMRVA